jgi:phosphatidylglycerol:prolipoprotein diacylglycerol transferase
VPISLAAWSWRHWAVSTATAASLKTRWAPLAPLARQPAVLPGVYLAFAIVGFLVALGSQAAILTREHIDVGSSLAASLIALLAGLIGAKLWYAVLHPDESIIKGGWAVDGFLVVAPLVAVVALRALDLPAGAVLDAVAPGVFLAVAIGRVGCFLTGCCAGRCTAARWGVWSSDRRVGARRIPAQLLESGAGLVIGVATSLVVMADRLPVHGAVFVASLAAYAVVRQALLRMRAERRASYRTLPMTAAAAGFVVLGVGLFSVHSGPMIAP